tara:strand:+ start:7334 stop:7771 length:438 start_codon:yes stop_codon:yes gene_type:complete
MTSLLPGEPEGHHDAQSRTDSGDSAPVIAARGGPDRIPCLVPTCSCSAAQSRFPGATGWICAKHYKGMPPEIKRRWKQLNARSRKLNRLGKKNSYRYGDRQRQWFRIDRIYARSWHALDLAIIHYFTASERPVGIEEFLKEHGLV